MHRHHDDRILILARLVRVGVKRHVFEEIAKRRIFVLFLVVDDIGLELSMCSMRLSSSAPPLS